MWRCRNRQQRFCHLKIHLSSLSHDFNVPLTRSIYHGNEEVEPNVMIHWSKISGSWNQDLTNLSYTDFQDNGLHGQQDVAVHGSHVQSKMRQGIGIDQAALKLNFRQTAKHTDEIYTKLWLAIWQFCSTKLVVQSTHAKQRLHFLIESTAWSLTHPYVADWTVENHLHLMRSSLSEKHQSEPNNAPPFPVYGLLCRGLNTAIIMKYSKGYISCI